MLDGRLVIHFVYLDIYLQTQRGWAEQSAHTRRELNRLVSVRHTTGRLWRGGQPSIEGRARQSNQKGLEKKGIYIGCIGIETQTKQKGRNTNQNKKERRKEKKIKETHRKKSNCGE